MKTLLLIVFVVLVFPVVVSAQVTVFPMSVDFAGFPVGKKYLPEYSRIVELTNATDGDVRVTSPLRKYFANGFDIVLDVDFFRPDYGVVVEPVKGIIVPARGRLFVRFRLVSYKATDLPVTYRDTVILRLESVALGTTDSIKIPVSGMIGDYTDPTVVAPQYDVFAACLCDFTRPQNDGLGVGLYTDILNPVGAYGSITIDSFTVQPLDGSGITFDSFSPNVQYDSAGTLIGRPLPVTLEPGEGAFLVSTTPYQLGEHHSVVRVFGHYGTNSESRWNRESTLRVLVRQFEEKPLSLVPSDEVFAVARGVAINDNYSFSCWKCELPDSVPMWLDTAYMTGPRQPAIELVKRPGSDSLLDLPFLLTCRRPAGYNVKITTGRTFPGLTTDTITALYHYDDPKRGRVDGVRKVTVQILIDSVPLSVVREVRPVSASSVEFSPNPSRDRVRVQYVGEGVAMGITLYDMQGRLVYREPVGFSGSGVVELDVSGLPVGTYRAVIEEKSGAVLVAGSVAVVR